MTQLVRADLPDSHHDPHHGGGRRRLDLFALVTDYAIIWMVLGLFILLAVFGNYSFRAQTAAQNTNSSTTNSPAPTDEVGRRG